MQKLPKTAENLQKLQKLAKLAKTAKSDATKIATATGVQGVNPESGLRALESAKLSLLSSFTFDPLACVHV